MTTDTLAPTVVPLEHRQTAAAVALLNGALGDGFHDPIELYRYVHEPARFAYGATTDTGALAGIGLADMPADAAELIALLPDATAAARVRFLVPEVADAVHNGTLGVLRSVAVTRDARGQGIATALVRARLDALWAAGATTVISVAWVRGDRCPAAGPLTAGGLHQAGLLDRFWFEDSVTRGYRCPDCEGPCGCTAAVFTVDRAASGQPNVGFGHR